MPADHLLSLFLGLIESPICSALPLFLSSGFPTSSRPVCACAMRFLRCAGTSGSCHPNGPGTTSWQGGRMGGRCDSTRTAFGRAGRTNAETEATIVRGPPRIKDGVKRET
ncbi:hypothetical protein QBC47DRAFT_179760 [Echria macrotheca]|uniref:Secreted protein n=1 Tax=Echria macrotheca TaxID=438768 RepID=A0AAJ0BDL9_9PEZI|nr:hypothetical protein QBC47DRAFT_179760 [Echria macrotheca]